MTTITTDLDLTHADIQRAQSLLRRIAEDTFSAVRLKAREWTLDGWHYSKYNNAIENIIGRVISKHCVTLIRAAHTKPSLSKLLAAIKVAKKQARKELAQELKSGRAANLKLKNAKDRLELDIKILGSRLTAMLEIVSMGVSHYPGVPHPTILAHAEGEGLPGSSGIYFIWDCGVVSYVGQSVNLRQRLHLGMHHAIRSGNLISYIEFERHLLTWAECYYIGICKPLKNFGVSASHNKYRSDPSLAVWPQASAGGT